ncbi:L-ornithine transporter [Trichosporon asahii var. asahii CBS 2479]|nr:L-ornithine transporter [Trichosporon asahii var. asahii CBS 2479]EJT46427.1 L-ornithine transporter [Trichosporon asahii var. asahii CBS 2479]
MAAKLFEHPFGPPAEPADRPTAVVHGSAGLLQEDAEERGLPWPVCSDQQGLSAPVVGAAMENATLFFVYNRCQAGIVSLRPEAQRDAPLTIPELALSGAGAGAVTSYVLTPIELIKCRMQVQQISHPAGDVIVKTGLEAPASPASQVVLPASMTQSNAPKGPLALIADTVRQNGIRGLWLGQTGTLLRETGGGAAWFGMYELLAKYFISRRQKRAAPDVTITKADLSPWELMAAGAGGGICYNVSLFPADSVKSTIQTYAELNPNKPVPGFVETARNIYKSRGIRGLYAGCALTCMRSGPSSAMIFALFETLTTHLGWIFDKKPATPAEPALK